MRSLHMILASAVCAWMVLSVQPAPADLNVKINIGGISPSAASTPEGSSGPPSWAPAHGRRAKHLYHYYPDAEVYFDPVRTLWFLLDAGHWVARATLPDHLRIPLADPVELGMDTDRPYFHHAAVKVRHPGKPAEGKVPAGHGKTKGKGKKK